MRSVEHSDEVSKEIIELLKKGKCGVDPNEFPNLNDYLSKNPQAKALKAKLCDADCYGNAYISKKDDEVNRLLNDLDRLQHKKYRSNLVKITILSVASACVLIGVLAVSLLYTDRSNTPVQIAVNGDSTLLAPTLILGSGEQINLLNTREHNIGNTTVDKSKNTLIYSDKQTDHVVDLNKIATPKMCKYKVILSDGTQVILNANSEFSYPVTFSGNKREVTLKGEAFFNVAKSKIPFVVKCDGVGINVHGTCFNVNSHYMNEVSTTLVSGSLGVTLNGSEGLIKPNEQCVANKVTGDKIVLKVNAAEYISWVDDCFSFNHRELEKMLNDIESWYGVEFSYDHKLLKDIFVTVQLSRTLALEDITKYFSKILDVKFIKSNENRYDIEKN